MSDTNKVLKLGVPKGSLEDATIRLFERAGWKIRKNARSYFPDINDKEISASLCRSQEIGGHVYAGVFDAGIAGLDWLKEYELDDKVEHIADLVYSKNSNQPCRWVLAVAGDSSYNKPQDLQGKRVATELQGFAARYFASLGVDVEIFYSWGATEAKIVAGLADAILEVTETGSTIRAHGLKIIDEVMQSHPIFIANKEALRDPFKKAKIEQITMLLQGALKAEGLVGLKMNVPASAIEAVVAMLPALNSPTVSHLRDSAWLSVETIIESGLVRDLIPKLRKAGAEGIIEYALNKVI